MIERRYPIQTVLAERKMFAGGGAVLPQQMMPQQQQSGGILASSGPLLDAVAAGAINPDGDGGGSLSEVQGFQDGGFANGGSFDAEVMTGAAYRQPKDFSRELEGATDEQLQQLMISIDPRSDAENVLPQVRAELSRRAAGSAISRAGADEFGSRVYDASSGEVVDSDVARQVAEMSGQVAGGVDPSKTAGERIQETLSEGLLAAEESEILDEGAVEDARMKQLLADRRAIRFRLSDDYNPVGTAGTAETFDADDSRVVTNTGLDLVPDAFQNWQNSGGTPRERTALPAGGLVALNEQKLYEPGSQPENPIMDDLSLNSSANSVPGYFGQDDTDSGYGLTPREAESLNSQGAPTEGLLAAEEAEILDEGGDSSRRTAPRTVSEGSTEGLLAAQDAVVEERDASGHANQPKDDTKTSGGGENPNIIKDPGANPFSLEAAVREFTAAMPKYERSEKMSGYNLIMMGAAIAAGESPNAITNIAKGVQKVLPAILKDQKDAESYLRSVKMAGTKYALSKRDKLESEGRAQERSRNTYYLDKEVTLQQPDGTPTTYKKGWNRLNDKTVNEISTITNQALTPLSAWNSANQVAAASAKARGSGYEKSKKVDARLNDKFVVPLQVQFPTAAGRAAGARPILLNPSELTNSYFEAVGTNDNLLALANSSADLIGQADQKVTGFNQIAGKLYDVQRAYLGDNTPNLLRSASITDAEGSTTYAENQAQFSDANRYNTQLRFLAIQMAPLLLGESGKTISDGDRRLIAEALGLAERKDGGFTWIQSASISRGELLDKVNRIRERLNRSRESLDTNFGSVVRDYGGTMPSQPELTQGAQGSRAATLSPFVLIKTNELDNNKQPIYDLTRRRA